MKIDPNAPLVTVAHPPVGGTVWQVNIPIRALIAAIYGAGWRARSAITPADKLAKRALDDADALLAALNEEQT